MKYFRTVEGDRLYLSPMCKDDAEVYTKWLNDIEVSKYISLERKVVSFYGESEYLDKKSSDGYNFSIILEENNELIGNISLNRVNFLDRTASIGMFIGPSDKKGKGYGPEALRLLINYGFKRLNLYNIKLNVYEFNERAIKAYNKVGFKECGRRSKAKFCEGKFYDVISMEILNEE